MANEKFEKFESELIQGRQVYSTSKLLKIINVKWGTFRHWVENGFVRADIPAEGPGTTNYFTKENLFRIALFKKLLVTGLRRFIAAELANEVELEWWADINYLKKPTYLLVSGDVPLSKGKKDWKDYFKFGVAESNNIDLSDFEVVIAINLNAIAENIDARAD